MRGWTVSIIVSCLIRVIVEERECVCVSVSDAKETTLFGTFWFCKSGIYTTSSGGCEFERRLLKANLVAATFLGGTAAKTGHDRVFIQCVLMPTLLTLETDRSNSVGEVLHGRSLSAAETKNMQTKIVTKWMMPPLPGGDRYSQAGTPYLALRQ